MRFQSLRYDEPGLQEDHQEEGIGFPQAMMTSLIYNKSILYLQDVKTDRPYGTARTRPSGSVSVRSLWPDDDDH